MIRYINEEEDYQNEATNWQIDVKTFEVLADENMSQKGCMRISRVLTPSPSCILRQQASNKRTQHYADLRH